MAPNCARDLRISSQTGSGKTVALDSCSLTSWSSWRRCADRPAGASAGSDRAPTRELAAQLHAELSWAVARAARGSPSSPAAPTWAAIFARRPCIRTCRSAAPRLADHLQRGSVDLSAATAVVLDEAPRADGVSRRAAADPRSHAGRSAHLLRCRRLPVDAPVIATSAMRSWLARARRRNGYHHARRDRGARKPILSLINLLLNPDERGVRADARRCPHSPPSWAEPASRSAR